MTEKEKTLSQYRFSEAKETLISAKLCFDNKLYKDSINRSYYVVFYAIKAILALGSVDFKRHKDVISHFNHHYVASEIFPKETGRKVGRLQKKRETSDYSEFYIASAEEAMEQIETAEYLIGEIGIYLQAKGVIEENK